MLILGQDHMDIAGHKPCLAMAYASVCNVFARIRHAAELHSFLKIHD